MATSGKHKDAIDEHKKSAASRKNTILNAILIVAPDREKHSPPIPRNTYKKPYLGKPRLDNAKSSKILSSIFYYPSPVFRLREYRRTVFRGLIIDARSWIAVVRGEFGVASPRSPSGRTVLDAWYPGCAKAYYLAARFPQAPR